MLKSSLIWLAAFNTIVMMAAPLAIAQTQPQAQQANPQTGQYRRGMRRQYPIYGHQLMTAEERTQYRNKMRSAKTWQEREQFRNEHHEQMKLRAKEKGRVLPDAPPARRHGRGMGPGMGRGMEPGQGMRDGGGPGR